MSAVDRNGLLTRTNFALGLYEKIQPGFPDEKRPKILGTRFGAKLETQNKDGEMQPTYYFTPIMDLVTLLAVSLQLNGLVMIWKIHQAKQNDAIRAALLCDESALLRHRPFNACAIANNSSR